MIATRDLAIYAAIVATADILWTLFHGVIRDRARIAVRVYEAEAVTPGVDSRQPILSLSVANRGRRATDITHVGRVTNVWRGQHELSADIMQQLAPAPRLDESQSRTFVHGARGGYEHGDLPLSRWYVVDGAGRIHPLRERYRQRLEGALLWPMRRYLRRRRRGRMARTRRQSDTRFPRP